MPFLNKNKLFTLILYALLILGACTTALGIELIMDAEDYWDSALCWLIAIVISLVLFGLWKIQETVFIPISPEYRDKRIWAAHILTPVFAVLVSGMSSYVFIFHDTATKMHMEQGVVEAQEAQGHANTAMNRILLFGDVVDSKVNTLSNLAESERSGLFSGRGGEGEVYRRIKEAERKLQGVSDLILQSELKVKDLLDSSNIHIGRMRRAIPIEGDPLQGLEAYTKAQRNFFTDFQALSEQNLTLQVKTMLNGFEYTMVSTDDRKQAAHLARVNREMANIAESLVAAMEEQGLKIEQPPEWSMGSPVYRSLIHIKGGFNIALMVIMLEISPLFMLYAMWAKHREHICERLYNDQISRSGITTALEFVDEILKSRKEAEKEDSDDRS